MQKDGNTERVSMRLPVDDLDALDEVIQRFGYENRSVAIRLALEQFNMAHMENWNTELLHLHVSRALLRRIDHYIENGLIGSRETAMEEALKLYLKELPKLFEAIDRGMEELLEKERAAPRREDYKLSR